MSRLLQHYYQTEFVTCGFDCKSLFVESRRFSNDSGSKNSLSSSSDVLDRAIAWRSFARAISLNFSKLSTWVFSFSANLSICSSVNGDGDDCGGDGDDDGGGGGGGVILSDLVVAMVGAVVVSTAVFISVVL